MVTSRAFNLNEYMNNPLATKQKYATSVINKIISEHPNTLLFKPKQIYLNQIIWQPKTHRIHLMDVISQLLGD